jgi:hypothetical protein
MPITESIRERFREAYATAHGHESDTPTLWILDPFDISSVPFGLMRACLRGRRDEVLVTWFAVELHRFCGDPSKENAIDEHFGTGKWRRAGQIQGEAARKNVLLEVYEESLRAPSNVHTGAFEIASKNETARRAATGPRATGGAERAPNAPGCSSRPQRSSGMRWPSARRAATCSPTPACRLSTRRWPA